jgi:HMG (high mobility group) box
MLTHYAMTDPQHHPELQQLLQLQQESNHHTTNTAVVAGTTTTTTSTCTTEQDVCTTHSSSSGSGAAPTVSRRRKKPKGFPKRPLSGYNIFFKDERVKVLLECNNPPLWMDGTIKTTTAAATVATHDNESVPNAVRNRKTGQFSVSFQELGKIIGKRWKVLREVDRRHYEHQADQDNLRYRNEMEEYNLAKRKRNDEMSQMLDDIPEEDHHHPNTSSSEYTTMLLVRPSDFHTIFQPVSNPPIRSPSTTEENHNSIYDVHYTNNTTNTSHLTASEETSTEVTTTTTATNNPIIPPGTEVVIPDPQQNGVERRYRVQYHFYKMTRRDAETYMTQLAHTPTVTSYGFTEYPVPPPGTIYLPNPYW